MSNPRSVFAARHQAPREASPPQPATSNSQQREARPPPFSDF